MSTEQQTRKHIIDKALAAAGWNVTDPTQVILEFDIIVDLPEGVSEQQPPLPMPPIQRLRAAGTRC